MPTVKSIAQVAALDPGELVSACKGKVKGVFTCHTGKIKQGARTGEDFSIQNIILQDLTDPAVEITCKFDGREAVPATWRGKVLNLVAHAGTKGLSGLKIAEDTYKGKTTKVLKVTASAEVTPGIDPEAGETDHEPDGGDENRTESPQDAPGTGKPPAAAQPAKPPQTGQSARQPSQGLTDQEKQELDKKDVHEAKKLAGRIANTWLLAYKAGYHVRTRIKEGITEEQFQAAISTIAIQLFRENVHYNLPYTDISFDKNGGAK